MMNTLRKRWQFRLTAAFSVAVALTMLTTAPARADAITVLLDRAKLVHLPDRIATLVIGNPMIADASLQAGGTMVLTGKGYGTTNLMALDRSGKVLMETTIRVEAPKDAVVVYRGGERQTYSCTPKCERQIMLGDAEGAFTAAMKQVTDRNNMAQGR